MKRSLPAVLLVCAAAAGIARAESVTIERVVAVVNTEVILLSELRDKAAQLLGQGVDEGVPEARKKLRQVLDRMVDDTLVLQQASELKLSVEEAEIDKAIDQIKESNHLDNDGLKQALADQGYTYASFRKDMRRQILRLKVVNTAVRSRVSVSEEDVKAFYEQSARQAGGNRQAHIRHVQIAIPAGASDKEVEARRKQAMRVLEESRGGADFAQLAKKYSDDATTKNDGGDLGWLKEGEGLSEAMNSVVFSMDQPNEVRGPVKTERGFEIVQMLERKESDVRPLSEVKDQIRAQLQQQQIEKQTQSWVGELHKKAHVEVRF